MKYQINMEDTAVHRSALWAKLHRMTSSSDLPS